MPHTHFGHALDLRDHGWEFAQVEVYELHKQKWLLAGQIGAGELHCYSDRMITDGNSTQF